MQPDAELQKEVVRLYIEDELSANKIHKHLNISKHWTYKVLKNNNVKIRPKAYGKKEDLMGKEFGKWVVIDYAHSKNKMTYWKCKCSCGYEKIIAKSNLLQNQTGRCKTCAYSVRDYTCGKTNPKYKGCEDFSGVHFARLRGRAKRRGLEFNLDVNYLYDLFVKQNKKCNLSGVDIFLKQSIKSEEEETASLDRIDSSEGYIIGNVQWVHKNINTMKWDLNQEYFISLCKKVSEHTIKT